MHNWDIQIIVFGDIDTEPMKSPPCRGIPQFWHNWCTADLAPDLTERDFADVRCIQRIVIWALSPILKTEYLYKLANPQ